MNIKINFDNFFEKSPDGFTIIKDRKIVEINSSSIAFMRANNKDELIGRTIYDFLAFDSIEEAEKLLYALENNDQIISGKVIKIKCLDGIVRRFEFSALSIEYHEGKAFLLISREIEDYLNVIDRLNEKDERLNAIWSALPDLIFIINDKKIIVDFLASNYSFLLHEPSFFLNKNIYQSLPEYLAKITDKMVDRVLATGQKEEYEYYLMINNIKKYFYTTLVKKSDNEVLAIIRDITERKQAELFLEEELRFNSIISALSLKLINCKADEIDVVINQALAEVGEYFNVDRTNIFNIDLVNRKMSNTYEWCAKDIQPEIDYFQNIDIDLFPELNQLLLNRELFISEDIDKVENENLKDILKAQGILSIILVPIFIENECFGFVGFDCVKSHRKFSENEIAFLKLFANLLSNIFQKIKAERELITKTDEINQSRISMLNLVDDLQKEIEIKEKAENELRISEQKFRTYVENTKGIIFVIQKTGKFSYVSPAITEIFGYNPKDLLDKHFIKYVHPDDTQKIFNQIKAILTTLKPFQSLPLRMKHKNGNYVWIIINAAPVLNKDKIIEEIIGIAVDLTELIEAKQQLFLTETRYQSLFENQIEAYALHEIILDETGNPYDYRFIDVNKAFLEMTGKSDKKEIVGKTVLEVWPNLEKEWINIFGNIALSGERATFEKSFIVPNKTFLVNAYSTEKMKFAVSFLDVTERKKSEIIRKIQLNIANAIIKSETFRELIITIREELSNIIDTTNFFVAAYDDKLKQFKTLFFIDEKEIDDSESTWDEEGSLSGIVMSRKTPLLLKKDEIDEIDRKNNISHSEVNPEVWLGVPIISKRKSIGIIVVQSYTNADAYDQNTVELLQIIANQMAVFFEHQEYESQIKLLSKAIEQSSVMVLITDSNNNIQFANPKFYEVTGYKEDEIIGKNPRTLKSNYHNLQIYKEMWRDLTLGKSWAGEFLNKNKFGNTYWVSAFISPIVNSEGRITNYIAIEEDITERKKLYEQIEASERQLRATWENSIDGMRLTDENGLIIDVNQALCNLYGVEREKLIGKPFYYLIKNYSGGGLKKFQENVKSGNIKKVKEYELQLESGRFIHLEITNSIVELDNKKKYLFSIYRDISEKKKMINELITAKETAEEMNRIKTQFFANMSHELRTPFMGILGYTELLKEKVTDDESISFLDGITRSSTRMIETLTNILDLTKLEAGKTETKKSFIDVENIILESYENFKYLAIKKNLNFNKNIKLPDDFVMLLNEKLFRSIINNLISNAIKFTQQGSVTINSFITDSKLFIEVEDTGIGIPPEKFNLIFDEFRQVSEGHARAFEGTGLGLSIVKKFTELLGGNVELESELNKGSKFTVSLPLN